MVGSLSKGSMGVSLTKDPPSHQPLKAFVSLTFGSLLGIVCKRWKHVSRADLSSDCGRL
jgi:hypothetical protein